MADTTTTGKADEDSNLKVNYVYEQMNQALTLFNQIFVDIAQTNGGAVANRKEEIEIHHYNLSGPQNNALTQLYGFLVSVQEHAHAVRLKGIHHSSKLKSIPLTFPDPSDKIESMAALQKRVFLLQEYLVQELNKSEKQGLKLGQIEAKLLQYEERDDRALKTGRRVDVKASEPISAVGALTGRQKELKAKAEVASRNVEPDPTENHEYYFGRYARKAFDGKRYFGLIVGFDEYFQVIIAYCRSNSTLFIFDHLVV